MKKIQAITSLGVLLALLAILIGPPLQIAYAAALTAKSDTMSSSKISTLANHDIQFTSPTGVAASATIIITFPADFSIAAAMDFTDIDVLDDAVNVTLAAAPAGATWGAVRTSATVITLTNGTTVVAAGSVIRIKIGTNATNQSTGVRQITNPTTTGSKTIAISGTFGDTGNIVVSILTDDQVAVSGTVAESMTFTLGATSVALGTLSSSAVTSGSHTVTLATNAVSGLTLTVSGTTLTAGANTITAMSTAAASSIGTEQFGINAKLNTTPAVGAECSGTAPIAAAATGYATVNSYKFVTSETVINSTAGINSTSCTISYIANILGSTEAGSYTTTLTYNATANF